MQTPSTRTQSSPQGISISGVAKSFGDNVILHDISLEIMPGELICFLGPSGCGKTTLLRSIAGLDSPDEGRIRIGDQVVVDRSAGSYVPAEKRELGMVFQHYALWPHMTIAENIAYPLQRRRMPKDEVAQKVRELAKFVGIATDLERSPSQLSGGQQQRIALARAIATEPRALLLDEPLSNLDATLRARLRRELRDFHLRVGLTTILVTHDQDEAAVMADRIAMLHEGRVLEIAPTCELLERPQRLHTARFVGFENIIEVSMVTTTGQGALVSIAGPHDDTPIPVGNPHRIDEPRPLLAFRASGARLIAENSSEPGLPGTVTAITQLRNAVEVEVVLDGADRPTVVVRHPREMLGAVVDEGRRIRVRVDVERSTLLTDH